jgi:hypothetical protein
VVFLRLLARQLRAPFSSYPALMAAPIADEGNFSSGSLVPLFQVRGRAFVSSTDMFTYDVSRDGKQFLVNRYLKPEHPSPLTIVLNATADTQK